MDNTSKNTFDPIQMVDLHSQYLRLQPEIDAAIAEVLHSTQFIKGSQVTDFERALAQYHACDHAIGVGNGTDALLIALMALGLSAGDEVITPNFSYVAAAEAMVLLGIQPIFVDVEPGTMNMSTQDIREKISPRTKAILPVHLFGQCANMNEIMNISEEFHLFVIEDNAQSIGADYSFKNGEQKKSGTIGHISTTSFFPSKNLGCFGDGGAILTNDAAVAEKVRMIANHGQKRKYFHEVVGVNSRLDTLQASILLVKLKQLDSFIEARQRVADFYDKKFNNQSLLAIPSRNQASTHVFHQYTLQINENKRDLVKEELAKAGIPSMIYYPNPLHIQSPYLQTGHFPVTEELCTSVLSLPIHTEMQISVMEYIGDTLLEICEKLL